LSVRNFAGRLARFCVVVLGMMFYCAILMRAQTLAPPATPPNRGGIAPLPRVTSLRLYVIDCGTLIFNRPEDYNLTREEVADTNMPVPCFLVIHPKGLLLFDTGLSDRLVGRPVYENVVFGYGQVKFNTLKGQLADIGVRPGDITYLALSHSHFDHVGNANDFAGAIWLAQKAEYDVMFGAHATQQERADFAALAHARTQMIDGDHDVFGDGTVILKYAPGHTPGHQCLYVALAKTGGVLIAGDLYHYAEEQTLHRMPADEEKSGDRAICNGEKSPALDWAQHQFLSRCDQVAWMVRVGSSTLR
jgi:N-acyl homoserine lactone hydrolase